MKTLFISLLLMCSLSSCATPLYTTSEVSVEQSYGYSDDYITYYYSYNFGGVICPVLYINALPWYYYRGVWYVVPQAHTRYITHYTVGHYHRISTRPPHRHVKPVYHPNHNRPSYRPNYKHNHGHNPGYKPGTHKPTHKPSVRPNNGRPNQHHNRPTNRPTHNGGRQNRR